MFIVTEYAALTFCILSDFINLTQVHNFTVSAQDIFYLPSTFGIYRKFYENFASIIADNETFCTVLLTSQVVIGTEFTTKRS